MGRQVTARAGRQSWSARIIQTWRQSVESIIETGRVIQQAKDALPHGDFEAMIDADLPFTASTARRLMIIAGDQRIAKCAHVHDLPPHWGTLYELTKLDDETFQARLAEGVIHPGMKRRDVARTREPQPEPAPDMPIDMRSDTVQPARLGAQGYDAGDGRKRIAITFDDDNFAWILARANAAGVSFNEETNTLIEWVREAMERIEREAGAA